MKRNAFTLFFIALGFLLGINSAFYTSTGICIFQSLLILGIGLLAFKHQNLIPFCICLLLGFLITYLLINQSYSEGTVEFKGIVISAKQNYFIFQSGLKRYYVYSKENSYEIGDILTIKGKISDLKITTYESRFNFESFLRKKGVLGTLKVSNTSFSYKRLLRIRTSKTSFLNKFSSETQTLLDSLLFNSKDYEANVIKNASSIGLLNLLSTSGILFGAFLRFLESILTLKISEEKASFLSFILGLFLLPLCLEKVGIIKAVILRFLKILNSKKRLFSYLELLSITALIILIFNIFSGVSVGFLLSFGVSYVLYVSGDLIKRGNQFFRKYFRIFLIQLFILPVSISYANGLHVFTPVFQIILLPLVEIFALFGLFSFVFFPLKGILNFLGTIIGKTILLFSGTDLFIPIYLSNVFPYLYYFVFFLCLLVHEMGDIYIRDRIVVFSISCYLISLFPFLPLISKEVTFINVGQGDCCLIRDKETVVMIDTGGNSTFDMAKETIIPYLRKKRIYHIDYLIGTHGDFDHVGAVNSLQNNFKVKKYVENAGDFPLNCGSFTLNNLNVYGGTEENESSLVLSTSFMGKSWLFMGDAPENIEKKIIKDNKDLDCDIIKIGHHGSSSSTSLEFLKKVTPSEAVISVDANNLYKHPSDIVLARLKKLGITIRRTDFEGTISYTTYF